MQFYNIVSNQDESFRQKQNKLDQLVLSLDSKNQVRRSFAMVGRLLRQESKAYKSYWGKIKKIAVREKYDFVGTIRSFSKDERAGRKRKT